MQRKVNFHPQCIPTCILTLFVSLGDLGWYSIGFENQFDSKIFDPAADCGVSGLLNGLTAKFSVDDIEEIPYMVQIEIPFTVQRDSYLCNEYKDVAILLESTCEAHSPNSQKRQYDTRSENGVPVIDYDTLVDPDNARSYITITWPLIAATDAANGPPNTDDARRLSDGQGVFSESELNTIAQSTTELLLPRVSEVLNSRVDHLSEQMAKILEESLREQKAELVGYFVMMVIGILFLAMSSMGILMLWFRMHYRLPSQSSSGKSSVESRHAPEV